MIDLHETDPATFEEIVRIGQRIGLFAVMQVSLMPNPEHAIDKKLPERLAAVSVDGTNLGLLSDGTLRVLQIIRALVHPLTRLLFIEEPEIAVHPGLLSRLLEEIATYSAERQILLSTQSPQVVDWAEPESLRLVVRDQDQTSVQALTAAQRSRVRDYLHDEGTLGEYIYQGAVDG